jgi:opacity protein-like surface antigen
MTKNIRWQLVLALMLLPAAAFAQFPVTAGHSPIVTASLGYSYLTLPIPSSTRIDLAGVGASITAEFRTRFGAKADFNYVQTENTLGTGQRSSVMSYMLGPMYYPVHSERLTLYVQALAGESRVTSIVPVGVGGYDIGNVAGPSWAIGAGIEHNISASIAIRMETDYLHTSYLNSTALFIGQSDLRLASSLVYRWGGLSEGRREHRRF